MLTFLSILRPRRPLLVLAALSYLVGFILRYYYIFISHPPEKSVYSDMLMYVQFARHLQQHSLFELEPWNISHPLGYSLLLSWLLPPHGSAFAVAVLHFVVSALVPVAVGLLGQATFGRKTALGCVILASLYFPFIEYGAYYLTEVHFTLWLCLGFSCLLFATRAQATTRTVVLSLLGGLSLSLAMAMKAVAIPAACAFFGIYGLSRLLTAGLRTARQRLRPLVIIAIATLLGALPIVGMHSAVCTQANRGNFCIAGNRSTADFYLGHSGRVLTMTWASDQGNGFSFGSPSAVLRNYSSRLEVPFHLYDSAANTRAALQWISERPGQAIVLSLNHVFDALFGPAMWPSFGEKTWAWADLFQLLFVLLLLSPSMLALHYVWRKGLRTLLVSRAWLVFSPVLGLAVTLLIATGEVRYRVPFDGFFMVLATAYFLGPLRPRRQPGTVSGARHRTRRADHAATT